MAGEVSRFHQTTMTNTTSRLKLLKGSGTLIPLFDTHILYVKNFDNWLDFSLDSALPDYKKRKCASTSFRSELRVTGAIQHPMRLIITRRETLRQVWNALSCGLLHSPGLDALAVLVPLGKRPSLSWTINGPCPRYVVCQLDSNQYSPTSSA